MEGMRISIALIMVVLSTINYCATTNVYNRPTGPLSHAEFLKKITPVQKYEWVDKKSNVPVGEPKYPNDDEVHSLLALVTDWKSQFYFGERPIDFLSIADYDERLPLSHCRASKFAHFKEICASAKQYEALVNYCNEAIKKQFQHCSEQGIYRLFAYKLEKDYHADPRSSPIIVSQEYDNFIKKHQRSQLPDGYEEKIEAFMGSLGEQLRNRYIKVCDSFIENMSSDLAFFFFNDDPEKFDYKVALKHPDPKYDLVWERCTIINDLEEKGVEWQTIPRNSAHL